MNWPEPRRSESPSPSDRAERDASEVERLQRENARLRDELAKRDRQIEKLERQLALLQQNSTTSSKPPSSDGLAGRPRERGRRTKSRRKPGGQPGHVGRCRAPVPPERVNHVVEVWPMVCRHCDHALPVRGRVVSGELRRHQVTELPPIQADITEYRCATVLCPRVGSRRAHRSPRMSPASSARS